MRYGSVPEVIEHGRTGFIVETADEMVEAARHIDEIDPKECRRAVEERFGSDAFVAGEAVDPRHVAFLVRAEEGSGGADGAAGAPAGAGAAPDGGPIPRWVRLLHRALSGAVTVDNMDYVRRDAYMCGVALGPVDVDRLIYYTSVSYTHL